MTSLIDVMIAAVSFLVYIGTCSAYYPLNMTCSPPVSLGGNGSGGSSYCDTSTTTLPPCLFTNTVYNYPDMIARLPSTTCMQPVDPRCTSAALSALIIGNGIKAAYCNDAFLVIHTDETTGYNNYLGSIKNPPASTSSNGTRCVTRYVNPVYGITKIPLYPVMLSTSDPSINNVNTNSFPNGGGDIDGSYMSTTVKGTGATYGLPSRGSCNELLDFVILVRI